MIGTGECFRFRIFEQRTRTHFFLETSAQSLAGTFKEVSLQWYGRQLHRQQKTESKLSLFIQPSAPWFLSLFDMKSIILQFIVHASSTRIIISCFIYFWHLTRSNTECTVHAGMGTPKPHCSMIEQFQRSRLLSVSDCQCFARKLAFRLLQ